MEYKYNEGLSLFYYPLENGKCEYKAELHDFDNLECFMLGVISYDELVCFFNNMEKEIKSLRGLYVSN